MPGRASAFDLPTFGLRLVGWGGSCEMIDQSYGKPRCRLKRLLLFVVREEMDVGAPMSLQRFAKVAFGWVVHSYNSES